MGKQSRRDRVDEFYKDLAISPWRFSKLPVALLKAGIFDWSQARSSISRSLLKSVVDPSLKDALSKALGDRGAFKDQDPIHDSLIEAVLRTRRDFSLPSGLLNGNPPPRKIASRIDGLTDGPRRHVIDQLQRAADTVWLMSVEASTLSQYASGLRSYLFFARSVSTSAGSRSGGFLPASERIISMWLTTFRNSESASNYLTHVRRWHLWLGLQTSWDSPKVSASLRGLRKIIPSGSKPRKRISPELLSKMVKQAFVCKLPSVAVASILAFAFLLRVKSELLSLSIDDVSISNDYVAIRLNRRKNLPKGETILRYCSCDKNSLLCPVEAMKISLELRLRFKRQDPRVFGGLSYRSFLVHIRNILSILKVRDAELYGTHAFRRGHAHALATSGSSQEELCRAGSWRYRSCVPARIYADISEIEAIACRQALPDIMESDSEDEVDME